MSLPTPFIDSMRILFHAMGSDRQPGLVKFSEIECRWSGAGAGLPTGILDCLRNLTDASGYLTFERFSAGLKICLLKNENQKQNNTQPPPKPPRMNADKVLSEFISSPIQESVASPSKRLEPRRHTLQNGIDYSRLKRLKQLEQEKTLLKETLLTVNDTQVWLQQKLHAVQEQIRHVGRSTEPPHRENDLLFELNLETHWTNLQSNNRRLLDELSEKREKINRLERQMERY